LQGEREKRPQYVGPNSLGAIEGSRVNGQGGVSGVEAAPHHNLSIARHSIKSDVALDQIHIANDEQRARGTHDETRPRSDIDAAIDRDIRIGVDAESRIEGEDDRGEYGSAIEGHCVVRRDRESAIDTIGERTT